jgi:hypothetical protein
MLKKPAHGTIFPPSVSSMPGRIRDYCARVGRAHLQEIQNELQ